MAIKTKSRSVVFTELTPALVHIFGTLFKFSKTTHVWVPENIIITSINDGTHSPNSRHYTNEAIDIRSKNFRSREDKRIFRAELQLALGPFFRVLFEGEGTDNEHFHVQVRKGMKFS